MAAPALSRAAVSSVLAVALLTVLAAAAPIPIQPNVVYTGYYDASAGATNPQYALQLTPGAFFAGATCNMTLSFMQASGCDAPYPLAAFNSSVPALVAPTGQPRSCTVVFSPHGFRSEGYTLVVELAPTSSVSGGTYGKTMNVSLPHGGPPQVLVAGLASSVQPVVVQVQNDGESTCCLAAGAQDRQWPSIAQACTPLGAGDTMLLDGPLPNAYQGLWMPLFFSQPVAIASSTLPPCHVSVTVSTPSAVPTVHPGDAAVDVVLHAGASSSVYLPEFGASNSTYCLTVFANLAASSSHLVGTNTVSISQARFGTYDFIGGGSWSLTSANDHSVVLGCGDGIQNSSRLAITGPSGVHITVRSQVSPAPLALNKILQANNTRGGDAHTFTVQQPPDALNDVYSVEVEALSGTCAVQVGWVDTSHSVYGEVLTDVNASVSGFTPPFTLNATAGPARVSVPMVLIFGAKYGLLSVHSGACSLQFSPVNVDPSTFPVHVANKPWAWNPTQGTEVTAYIPQRSASGDDDFLQCLGVGLGTGCCSTCLVRVVVSNSVAQDVVMGSCFERWVSNYTSLGTSVRVSVLDGDCNPVFGKIDLLTEHAPFDDCPQPTNYCT